LTGPSSGLTDMVPPNNPGAGSEPFATAQEAYKFRIVGQSFNGSPSHVRWVQGQGGKWHPAYWITYDFQAEHLLYVKMNGDLAGLQPPPFGMNQWKPVSITDIYRVAHNNPALTLYLPDICGPVTVVGDDLPSAHPGNPIMTRPR
jgi:hypothetical protein